jgi:hypothetical protein
MLVSFTHSLFDVKTWIHFFAGVKDIVRVKDMLGGNK